MGSGGAHAQGRRATNVVDQLADVALTKPSRASASPRSTRSPKLRHLSQVFCRRTLGVPAPHLQTRCLASHFGWRGRSSSVIGLRRSGWRLSAYHDRRSPRKLGQNQADPEKPSSAPRLAVRGDASLGLRSGVSPPGSSTGSGITNLAGCGSCGIRRPGAADSRRPMRLHRLRSCMRTRRLREIACSCIYPCICMRGLKR